MPSSHVVRGASGGAFSPTGTFTVHVKSAPARSATAARMSSRRRARLRAEPPNSSSRRFQNGERNWSSSLAFADASWRPS